MRTRDHERWGSQLGFVLAAIGSAAGLGNLWRFSCVAGESGGATFLIIYVAGGVRAGIEASNKVAMPNLLGIVRALPGLALTLEGASKGLEFLFTPDWSAFERPGVSPSDSKRRRTPCARG